MSEKILSQRILRGEVYIMASNNNTILIGQMMKPEVRTTKTGKIVAKARMVIKTYGKDDDNDMWISVNMWENLAQNTNYSFPDDAKTIRVMVSGRLQEEKWTGKDGNERKELVLTADQVAVCLDYQTVGGVNYSGDGQNANTGNFQSANSNPMPQQPVARPMNEIAEGDAPF